jgi:hypothetical protein
LTKTQVPFHIPSTGSFDVQRQIGASMVASLAYAGSKSTKLARPNSQNPDYIDRFGQILAIHHGGNSTYESFTARFEGRFAEGLTVLAHYTLAKQEDEFFNTNGYTNVSAIGGQWHRNRALGLSDGMTIPESAVAAAA